jgi:hypothetical protein
VEGFLYNKVASKDAKNSYEDTICIISYFVPREVGILECNLHFLWVATIFGFVIMSPSVPTWVIVQVIIITLLLVVKQCILNQS